jgi:hypothetical protein
MSAAKRACLCFSPASSLMYKDPAFAWVISATRRAVRKPQNGTRRAPVTWRATVSP